MMTHSDDAKWDEEFARQCARLRQLKQARGWLTQGEQDDLDTDLQCAAFRRVAEKRRQQMGLGQEP